jgi:hypothetical protein
MIKKVSSALLAILLTGSMLLTACSAQPAGGGAAGGQPSGSAVPGGQGGASVTDETKLALGTLKLEGTSQAVTTEQAKVLLPLWKAENSLSSNSATAETEMQALLEQIKSGMTSDQLQAINKLDFTAQGMSKTMSDLNPQSGGGGTTSTKSLTSSSSSSGGGMGGPGGGGPGGGGPGGGGPGGDMGGGMEQQPSTTQTASSTTKTIGVTARVNTSIVKAVITLLSKKVK